MLPLPWPGPSSLPPTPLQPPPVSPQAQSAHREAGCPNTADPTPLGRREGTKLLSMAASTPAHGLSTASCHRSLPPLPTLFPTALASHGGSIHAHKEHVLLEPLGLADHLGPSLFLQTWHQPAVLSYVLGASTPSHPPTLAPTKPSPGTGVSSTW